MPSYIKEVQWINEGFRGLLPYPFNSSLGGMTTAPPYFNDKNKGSHGQYLQDIKLYTFYMELDLQKPYPTRGSDLLTWEFTNLKYSRVEIDEVRFEWAECMLDYI
ncbi:hypothetical protein ZIOFF_018691 [Zingiber officinale]|uniref:Uncharacterized protein n=1 Tax=Zingiber officinale TaxID=94328 RepID=A0A8J5HQM9_ZINOF|nr:hypothetical protein ZIOFF_018691 [Zingiber officinale]